jgi:Xaa-Pro aminopeptidase/Xaa-Pro dipeptidase
MHDMNPRVPFDATTRKEYLDLPFPISEYQQRVDNTRRLMRDHNLEGLIAFGDQNDMGYLAYLANFEPMIGRGAVVITPEAVSLITDSAFHGEPMHSLVWKSWIERVRATGPSFQALVKELQNALSTTKGNIGIVGSYSFPARELGLNVVDVERPFLQMKSRKTPNELRVMKEASRITSCGMRAAVDATRKGVRETEIAAAACGTMFEEGASRLAFSPIVVSGLRAGTKHDFPSRKKIEDGDMVYIDIGAISNGYYCDMSRTVLIGKGDPRKRDALDSILEIHNELTKRIRPGVSAGEVAREGERMAESRGWIDDFWAMGHGLGTGFLELPMFTPTSEDVFDPGMVFAYEPMIVRLGLGTAVVEDTVAVTDSGCITLTECEQKLW